MPMRSTPSTLLGCSVVCLLAGCWGSPRANGPARVVSYEHDIAPVVADHCTTCHAGENPDGWFVLTSYDDVRQHVEEGRLLKRIDDAKDPMPPSGQLPDETRQLFHDWAAGGFQEFGEAPVVKSQEQPTFDPPKIEPIDVNEKGFELLESVSGHWVGSLNLMGRDFDWWAFDFRPIAPSHVHGIYEGGTIGNLFTSFFVAEFNGTRAIMARNGGILNGLYRTSYFVLDTVEESPRGTYYRLVDAYGGEQIMWMELVFHGDRMEFRSYTSRFGATEQTLHVEFRGRLRSAQLATAAAGAVGFPRNVVEREYPNGLPIPDWGGEGPITSASYMWDETEGDLVALGRLAGDPIRIDQMPHLAQLTVSIDRPATARGKKLLVYLSDGPLTDDRGRFAKRLGAIRLDVFDRLLSFPELAASSDEFTFTYLHPGPYHLTVVADVDGDGFPSTGDLTSKSLLLEVKPESRQEVTVGDFTIAN